MSLDNVTQGMRERVAKNGGIAGKKVVFDFGDDGAVCIDGTADPATVTNDASAADCRIKVSLADFMEIAAGKQNAQMAFMMGKLKVEGDMGIAMQLGKILG
ncbi:MAG: SCP2 sterol-binding domain-containing protein [Sphingomonadaceae bacterium]|uniref:SCP2 sterol-binding domain-containing protein n=1 Tax=Thermaurantiacus sp. TaxID=2820283 RepID=UPI00298ED26A|nr:SCP2 sterol-binding domain-containing protein [Thermaurantiacus sp.]MCS6986885.1 SCP2 sterol-binding domain-containing protein [Sphingomonadaceae bacterium]MDW8415515.1 SCP2 sterol-binding domain-containing protein [Thermaurantiacus sp.]